MSSSGDRSGGAIFSFFSGLGFLDLGFERAGFRVAQINEVSPHFACGYLGARVALGLAAPAHGLHDGSVEDFLSGRGHDRLADLIREERRSGLPVGFLGGPPCPDFSVAGKNRGGAGERGRLSATYIDLIARHRPDFFLFENVRGLWSTARHRAFYDTLVRAVRDAGYRTSEMLINARWFGVPQDRDRVFLFGVAREFSPGEPDLAFPWLALASHEAGDVAARPWPASEPFAEGGDRPCPDGVIEELTAEHWFRRNGVADHPNARHHFTPRAGLARFRTVDEGDTSRKSSKRPHRWRYSPAVAYGNNEVHLHPYRERRLSVAEALALQSLPAAFALPEGMPLSHMFKGIGNGVPYLVAHGLARTIGAALVAP